MFEVILFDLGRVVVGLGDSPVPKCWLKAENSMPIETWFISEFGQKFEKGQISAVEFTTQFKQQFELEQSVEEIMEAFTAWPTGIFPTMPQTLTELRGRYHLAVLSNTNELHFPRLIEEFGIAEYFDTIFVSHHMHKAKPERAAFEHVLDVLEVAPDKVLFLDDNQQNIEAAASLGIISVQVCGEEQVIQALKSKGVL
ncbi:HAD family phosphatase [Vibrio sp. DW001]|uniref:HAD family hydrolase n=1 Tax=Vibrio sp. DW001 TaxID=2912315 RepID=UPI0023B10EC1|nr:HAD family phosphatase [Vibrio sp. DW001]WED25664.1 HAD family phosphatase [Vibrio sp. DW001]